MTKSWNCCGASVGNIGGGSLPTTALSGRNLAKAEEQQATDVITGCAACYLNTHGANERIKADIALRGKVNESLAAADMSYEANLQVRHACEVIVNEVGIEKIKERVTNPLEGLKVAGYVGCQTVRPFANTESGGNYDTFDDPEFLDQFTEACGAEAVDYDVKTPMLFPHLALCAKPMWRCINPRSTGNSAPTSTYRWCSTASLWQKLLAWMGKKTPACTAIRSARKNWISW